MDEMIRASFFVQGLDSKEKMIEIHARFCLLFGFGEDLDQ